MHSSNQPKHSAQAKDFSRHHAFAFLVTPTCEPPSQGQRAADSASSLFFNHGYPAGQLKLHTCCAGPECTMGTA
eukprot:711136-Pelagomonas_calceolata.AAC.6